MMVLRTVCLSLALIVAHGAATLACTVFPVGMWAGCGTAERVVVGTILTVDEYTLALGSPDEKFLREALFQVEQTVSGPTAPDTVALIGPEIEPSMCSYMAVNRYVVGGRYLLRLDPELAPGRFIAPTGDPETQPGRIALAPAPSAEENILLEYAGYYAEHCTPPFQLSAWVDTLAVVGGPVHMRLSVRNHLAVPLSMADATSIAGEDIHSVHLQLAIYQAGERWRVWLPLRELDTVVEPGAQATLDLDLADVYGVHEAGWYDVAGWASVPMASGERYRDLLWSSASALVTFAVRATTTVSLSSWATVKHAHGDALDLLGRRGLSGWPYCVTNEIHGLR